MYLSVTCIIPGFASKLDLIHGSLLMKVEAVQQVACLKSSLFTKVYLTFKVLNKLSGKRFTTYVLQHSQVKCGADLYS